MLDNTTVSKLREMKLGIMATTFSKQLKDANASGLSFAEQFGLLVDAEWTMRRNNRLKRLMRSADYAFPGACVEDIEYHADRKLDKALIQRLASCNYVRERHNALRAAERRTFPTL